MLESNDEVLDGAIGGETIGLMDVETGSKSSADAATGPAPPTGLCGCMTVAFYKPYFDVDTVDVVTRLKSTITFVKDEKTFLTAVTEKPDAYGPFWTSSTLIFIISATSNLSGYLAKGYNYDFQLVSFCVSLIYGYLILVSAGMWAAFMYFIRTPVPFMPLLCLFGYSLALYIPCTILAMFPFLSWPAVLIAGTGSTLFVLKSLVPHASIVQARKDKAMTLLSVFVAVQTVFMLIIKFKFYTHSSS